MQHWLTALVAPLFQLNPIKYTFDKEYRRKADYHGTHARRVFRYQVVFAVAVATSTVTLLFKFP